MPLGMIVVRDEFFLTVSLRKNKIIESFEKRKIKNYVNIKEDLTMIYYYKYIERKDKDNILIINSISNSQYNACLELEKLIKNTNIKKEEKLAIL